ncbi:MAG: TolC family protein [Planctomycetota bacterium]|jgi:outer membrane protein TolC
MSALFRLPVCVRLALIALLVSCKSPREHRLHADRVAAEIIQEKQQKAFGRTEPFSIERPADILRRRLLEAQGLPYVGPDSLGTDALEPIKRWPEPDYPARTPPPEPWSGPDPFPLSLMEALQVGARNARDYQSEKEGVFVTALDLDLQRNNFRTIFSSTADVLAETDLAPGGLDGVEGGAVVGASKLLKGGALLAGQIGIDLVKLLTGARHASLGLFGDATITIPLLRGAGKHVVLEPLTQAERDMVYALRDFQRFKRVFAVRVASEYFDVLRLLDRVRNAEENYRNLIVLSRRTRALAAAGRLPGVQVDQARQDELRARDGWIAAVQSYENRLDRFKETLGLPPDARVELRREELERMTTIVQERFADAERAGEGGIETGKVPPADAQVELPPLDVEPQGPYEMHEDQAVGLAFDHRQDLRVAQGRIYDAQRGVVVAADALRAGLTLSGTAAFGGGRSLATAILDNAKLDPVKGLYTASLLLDLPLERTAERNAYRESYVELEASVRSLQALEDSIKIDVRETLRGMLATREGARIQVEAVRLARDRVTSTGLFLEAGRAQVRDVLEAQDALLGAQNAQTEALVSYRIASLELQRDLGVLQVDETGIWTEYRADELD